MIGEQIGPYQVIAKLGEGGMGQVFRARDTRLNRDVAIKVLPAMFAADTDRVARFTREAQALAALNHPNIAAIHGLEHGALVLELVDGEDLSAVIARGPMPVDEALPIARQLADALEAAHDRGIVHRDLKPGNIKVRADGTVKVLDFGLAKALDADQTSGEHAQQSPTMTARATQAGIVLGTAAYMAPEQAKGKPVDRRADIWAFGCVLFEMLAGRRPFEGDDISSVIASVLRDDPKWPALPTDLPAPLVRLLKRCLEKDPRRRLSSIGDARLELDDAAERVSTSETFSPAAPGAAMRVSRSPALAGWIVSALAGAAIAAAVTYGLIAGPPAAEEPTTRLSILPPAGKRLYPDSAAVVLSPDGKMVAFMVGAVARSDSELWVRSLDTMTARRLDAADGAILPFWSPDSKRIAFFSSTKLMTVPAAGGRADILADAPGGRGGTWIGDTIVYAPDAMGPLFKIPAAGGTPEPATKLDPSAQEVGHRFPAFLPDREHFLYAALPGKNGRFNVFAGSLRDDSKIPVGTFESAPVYADPGYLLFARQGVLNAVPFDARALKITGTAAPLSDEPASILEPAISWTAGNTVSVSATGALAYYSAGSQRTVATWYDDAGVASGTLPLPPGHYDSISISPDGTRGVVVKSLSPSESTLWLVDMARGGATPLSTGPGRNDAPVWSPDGSRVVWTSNRDGIENFYAKNVNDPGPEQLSYASKALFKSPVSWSADGTWIIAIQLDPITAQNVWRIDPTGRRAAEAVVRNPGRDVAGHVSPDGKWLTFASDDSGRFELYVQAFPDPGRRTQVSSQGGLFSWWTPDGRHIVYLGTDLRSLWRADVTAGPAAFSVDALRKIATLPNDVMNVAAMPDRRRFIAIAPENAGIASIIVVQRWHAPPGQ